MCCAHRYEICLPLNPCVPFADEFLLSAHVMIMSNRVPRASISLIYDSLPITCPTYNIKYAACGYTLEINRSDVLSQCCNNY